MRNRVEAAPNPYFRSGFTQSSDEFFFTASNQIVKDLRSSLQHHLDTESFCRPRNLYRRFRPRSVYRIWRAGRFRRWLRPELRSSYRL